MGQRRINWPEIKKDYIMDATMSYRQLCDKYNVSSAQLNRVAKEERWVALREQYQKESIAEATASAIAAQADNADMIFASARKLLAKVDAAIDGLESTDINAFDKIARTLKSISDVLMIRSEADMREQEARIKSLNMKNGEDRDNAIIVELGRLEEYAG